MTMLNDYIRAAMRKTKYVIIPDDGTFYGSIPGFQGVWANAVNLEDCRNELSEVLEEWILLHLRDNDPLPEIEGKNLSVDRVSSVAELA